MFYSQLCGLVGNFSLEMSWRDMAVAKAPRWNVVMVVMAESRLYRSQWHGEEG